MAYGSGNGLYNGSLYWGSEMDGEEWIEVEEGRKRKVVTVVCSGCGRHVMMKAGFPVTVMGGDGWEHRWYCDECYRGFEYGRDF